MNYGYGQTDAVDDIMSRLYAIYDDVNNNDLIETNEDVYSAYT